MARLIGGWMIVVMLLTACKRSPGTNPPSSGAETPVTNQRTFQVKGVIKAVRPQQKEIEIKHEAISGYMPAMTMPFDVKDTNELTGLEAEQLVSFRLHVTDTEGWVDQIERLGPGKAQSAAAPDPVHVVRDVEPLQVGDTLPEYHLTNQFGQAMSTAQFKGQALAITFLFTRCPFPTFCPRLANDFAETQEKLLSLQGGPTNWQLLTVSFDPEFDTPEVLKAYGEAHHYDPSRWTLATGELSDITALGEEFGMAFWRDSNGSITHNLRTAVVDANGRLQKLFQGRDWNTAQLASEMVKAAKP